MEQMRIYNESDEDCRADAERLNAKPWMLTELARNPKYVHWGPHEDYMWKEGDNWDCRVTVETWKEFGWELNSYNECVNFYFFVHRPSKECDECLGNFHHPDAQWVTESFFRHGSPFTLETFQEYQAQQILASFGGNRNLLHGRGTYPSEEVLQKYGPEFREFCEAMRNGDGYWSDKITQDEVDALLEAERLWDFTDDFIPGKGRVPKDPPVHPTAEEVNQWQRKAGMGHDGINRHVLFETRLKRFGIPPYCPKCEGNGTLFTDERARLGLTLWILHPRKGCSRGVEILEVEQEDLPQVYAWLREAAVRNAKRFEAIPG